MSSSETTVSDQNAMSQSQRTERFGMPPEIEQRIRAHGPVLDMQFTQAIYGPLLASQCRDGVLVERDHAYGDHERHRIDVYRPERPADGSDTLLFLHGGGFVRGDKSERENIGQYFARHGFVVGVANYRLAPSATWPAGAEDAIAAFTWLRAHAARFGGDANRIFLIGESAGAAHVAAAALIRRFHPPGGLHAAGIVLISGVYDVELEHRARRQFGVATPDPRNEPYFGTDFSRYGEMSTVRLIDAPPLPTLITYAELDMPQMQVQAGQLFAALIKHHGFNPDLKVVRGHNHLTQLYSINTGDETLTTIIQGFIAQHR